MTKNAELTGGSSGTRGRPGNPHARRVHRLRSALLDAVTPDDIGEIVQKLISMAKSGDIAAIKELLDRTLGKPIARGELTGADGAALNLNFGRVAGEILAASPISRRPGSWSPARLRSLVGEDRDSDNDHSDGDGERLGHESRPSRPGA